MMQSAPGHVPFEVHLQPLVSDVESQGSVEPQSIVPSNVRSELNQVTAASSRLRDGPLEQFTSEALTPPLRRDADGLDLRTPPSSEREVG